MDTVPTKLTTAGTVMLLALLVVLLTASLVWAPSAHATVTRGIADNTLTRTDIALPDRQALLHEIGARLNAHAVRLTVLWPQAEPSRGTFNTSYLNDVKAIVDTARTENLKVIVTVVYVPRWASDSSYWGSLQGFSGYQSFYPVAAGSLDDLGDFAGHLATLLKGEVLGYEIWNEPNLWPYIFPQRTSDDLEFAAHTYLKYLKAMSPAIHAADPDALVIGGVTAPTGTNDAYRTSPQLFDKQLKRLDAGAYFDAVSHHPYCVGGRGNLDPALPPLVPAHTVELSNIGTLLDLFPDKPFYLTEWAFSTAYSLDFGNGVTPTQQAQYLTKSYRMAARYPQIKMLLQFMVSDSSPSNRCGDANGYYGGLRRMAAGGGPGAAKPSWYAFARGNRLSLYAPKTARRCSLVRLRGRLTCASVGGVSGRHLVIKVQRPGRQWTVLRGISSGTGGYWSTKVRLGASERFRLTWPGVVSSPIRLVRTR